MYGCGNLGTPPPLYPFELHFIDRYMLILIKNLKSDGSNNFGQTIGRISKALKKVFNLSPYQVSGG